MLVDSLPLVLCPEEHIPHYNCYRVADPIWVDGKINEGIWGQVNKSDPFRDLVSGDDTYLDTRVALVWDDTNLYVAYWVEEPYLQASLLDRDAPIYKDNDVELFIAGKNAYYELEINAYNTIYEVFFIWEASLYRAGYNKLEIFDRSREGVKMFNGVGMKNHPRGQRIGYWNWDFPGLRHAVSTIGTINDDRDVDQGWHVELALPWAGMKMLTLGEEHSLPPKEGDVWRMDFSRFNQRKAPPPQADSGGWAWSPHGIWDSHIPECFTYIHFIDQYVSP
ncbi:MAG: carbohydrate-binding family 9-like protein [Saprospiraceae bacterium]|nr:carbohydrate-binding family 9-like protein [Saprospiraceae bacterium]